MYVNMDSFYSSPSDRCLQAFSCQFLLLLSQEYQIKYQISRSEKLEFCLLVIVQLGF